MKKKNLKQNQAHGKPKKANPPTDSHKKKKKNTKSKIKLTHCTTVTSLQRLQRKSFPNILRQSTDYNLQSKIKTYQKQYTVFIKKKPPIHTLYQNGKTKPKPQSSSSPQLSSPIVVTDSSQLAPHHSCRSQSRPSSQIDLLRSRPPVLSSPPRPSQSPSESPVLSSSLKVFLSSLSFSLFFSLSLSIFISLKSESVKEK